MSKFFRHGLIPLSMLIAFFATGCSSDQPEHRHGGPGGKRPSAPPLAGKETFFNGQITAELTVGHGPGFERKPDKEADASDTEPKPHGSGGGFSMGGGGGGMHAGGGSRGGGGNRHRDNDSSGGGDSGGTSDPVERQQVSSMRHAANPNPPVMIHLRFTNNGATKAELLIADFLSPLGNFVVEPEKLSLEPGQTVEVEPMTSRLDADIASATVTLALRLAGQGEKKNVVLTIVPQATPETPPDNPAPGGK